MGWPIVSGYSPLSIHPTYLWYMSGSVIIGIVSLDYTTQISSVFYALMFVILQHHAFEPSTRRSLDAYRETPFPKRRC